MSKAIMFVLIKTSSEDEDERHLQKVFIKTNVCWECILNNAEQGVLLCTPFFLPINTGSEEDREGQDKKIILITPSWQTVVVPPNIEDVNKETSNPSIIRKSY